MADTTDTEQARAAGRAILDLNTLTPDTVTINGTAYELKRRSMMPILPLQKFARQRTRTVELMQAMDDEKLTDAEAEELESLLDKMCRDILIAPDAVHRLLPWYMRFEICVTFWTPPTRPNPTPAPAADQAPAVPPIGANSSRDSRLITAAIPSDG